MRFLRGLVKSIDKLNRGAYWVVGGATILACTLVFLDVILRYFFRAPTSFGYEASLWLTLIIAVVGGGYITQAHEHITVDILYLKMPERGKRAVNYLVYLTMIFLAIVMITYGGERVIYYFNRGTRSIGGMQIYLWIKWLVIPLSGALLLLQSISEIIKETVLIVTGTPLLSVKGDTEQPNVQINQGEGAN